VTCNGVVHLVEAIAAWELEVEDGIRAHFESCPSCAAALASARRLEVALQALPAPEPPARFTPMVIARIRHERWRSEQNVDRIFNVAIAAALVLVVGGVVAMTNVGAVMGLAGWVWGQLAQGAGRAVYESVPMLLTYVAAAGLLMSALAMWWWAERRLSL
jgi:anti-sigma factor RsiW